MVRYAPITSRDDAPELAPWPRVVVAIAALAATVLAAWLGTSALTDYRAWRRFESAPRISVTLAASEGEIEQAIARTQTERVPLELAYRDASDGPVLIGRFHRFARTVGGRGALLSRPATRRILNPTDPDEEDWLREIRSRGSMQCSRVGADLVSRVDRPDARGDILSVGLFAVPLLTVAILLTAVAITGNPVRSRRSPVAMVYLFHAVCLLPLTVSAVLAFGVAYPIGKALRLDVDGLVPESIALGIYAVVLVLLVPWVGVFVRLNQLARPSSNR